MSTPTFLSTRRTLAAATALGLALAVPGAAQAGSTAYGDIEITNGIFFDATTFLNSGGVTINQITQGTEITLQTLGSSVSEHVARDKGPGSIYDETSSASDNNVLDGIDFGDAAQLVSGAAPTDLCTGAAGQCLGIPQNTFGQQDKPLQDIAEFARVAVQKNGVGVAGLLAIDGATATSGGPVVDKALSEIISQVTSNSTVDTVAQSIVGFEFTANSNIQLGFTADLFFLLESTLDADVNPGSSATSEVDFTFKITEETGTSSTAVNLQIPGLPFTSASFGLDSIGLNHSSGVTNAGVSDDQSSAAQGLSTVLFYTANALEAGKKYSVIFTLTSSALLNQEVPEPGSLGLLGISLLAVAGIRRRRQLNG